MKEKTMLIDKLNWRYATKKMDPSKIVPEEKLHRILEATNLAPTSSGLQPFEIIVVSNSEVKAKLAEAAYGQAQLNDSTYVLVFAAWDNYTTARIDAVVERMHVERGTPKEALAGYFDNLKNNDHRKSVKKRVTLLNRISAHYRRV
jgi:nitroreductase